MSFLRWFTSNAVVLALLSTALPVHAQDAEAGERVFNKCKACHQVGEEAKNRVGPPLNGIVGASAGTAEGFKYSPAMAESGLVWDEATLSGYLSNPKTFLPGNKMTFVGLKSEQEIADVIAYLEEFGSDGETE